MDPYTISVLSNVALFSFLAISAWLLMLVGCVSFGQQVYFAIGAYIGGLTTAVFQMPFALAVIFAVLGGALSALLVALSTLRLSGLHFSIASLAFAEFIRSSLNVIQYQRTVDGYLTGPDGANGFRDIRWIFDVGLSQGQYFVIILAFLLSVIVLIIGLSFGRDMMIIRCVGENARLASAQGINPFQVRLIMAGASGAIAALGGVLYAHMTTYIEPAQFSVMIGVHALAYGLIGGLGTVLGPVLGVLIDIGALETLRFLSRYRMIVFGGLVVLILIWRPRGLLDETFVARVKTCLRR